MKKVRFGVVGCGGMGQSHMRGITESSSRDVQLSAVADVHEDNAKKVGEEFDVPFFFDPQEMFESGLCDAVLIATPHYWHAPLTIRAARAKLPVLCEKPLAATVGPARAMLAECKKRRVPLGVMFQRRTNSLMRKIKQIVDSGRIGEVYRVRLICSSWFRTQAYYDMGSWRGTWSGEGGGVLTNQAPHHLDLFQWICGAPRRVHAILSTRAHKIEVEDTADILLEYKDGKVGYICASTAEEPGQEQFMICGEKGTILLENNKLLLGKLKTPTRDHIKNAKNAWEGRQEAKWQEVKVKESNDCHFSVSRNFAQHLRLGKPLTAPGEESLAQVEMTNAAYLSGFLGNPVDLPVDASAMERLLTKLIKQNSNNRSMNIRKEADRELKKLLRKK